MRKRPHQGVGHESEDPPERFVAVHKTVRAELVAWDTSQEWKGQVPKFLALCDELLKGDQAMIQALLRRNCAEQIKEFPGLLELGPKQKKGGAPRVFLFREGTGSYLVAAGLEKGSGGVREIGTAKNRVETLKKAGLPRTAKIAAEKLADYIVCIELPVSETVLG